jgi:hypothetical protein
VPLVQVSIAKEMLLILEVYGIVSRTFSRCLVQVLNRTEGCSQGGIVWEPLLERDAMMHLIVKPCVFCAIATGGLRGEHMACAYHHPSHRADCETTLELRPRSDMVVSELRVYVTERLFVLI